MHKCKYKYKQASTQFQLVNIRLQCILFMKTLSMQQTFSNKRRPHTRDEANDQDCDDRSHESGVRLFGSWQAWVGAEVEIFNLQERVFTVGVLEEGVEGDALLHPREGDSKLGVLFKGLEDLSD